MDATTIDELRAIQNRFGDGSSARKSTLLERCSVLSLDDPGALVAYHDILLFLLAYPEDRALLSFARRELRRVAAAARRIYEGTSVRARRRLAGSGIAWSWTSHAYSYEIARWLALEHARHAEINDEGGSDAPLRAVLRLCMPPMEFELLGAEFAGVDAFLDEAKGASRLGNLAWLIAQLERLPCSEEAREHLYESLKSFVTIYPRGGPLSRTFARGLPAPVFFHRQGLLRSAAEATRALDEPLPPRRSLSRTDAKTLIDVARGILAMLGRETDPITLCAPEGVGYLELGRGVAIALYAMRPLRRFPLDTHVGFVLFKNAVPVGYGGGWPFLDTCRIGVNIFAPFRGGESALLFCQVLRVYRARFGAERFLVEPYQFGAGNREGLASGAFWFYYRLGFRPVLPALADLARGEFARMSAEAGYRPPLGVMRRLASADVELRLRDEPRATSVDPYRLSAAVSEWIEREFAGDRETAEREAMRRVSKALGARRFETWPAGERHAFTALCPLIAMVRDLDRWSPRERRACLALMRAKGAKDETRYFTLALRHRRLREALAQIAGAALAKE
jgi:hypothetical protein